MRIELDTDAIRAELAEAEQEHEALSRRLDELRTVLSYCERHQKNGHAAEEDDLDDLFADLDRPESKSLELYGTMKVHEAVEAVLRWVGHPMRTPEISYKLKQEGYGRKFKDLPSAVFTALDRYAGPDGGLFRKVSRGVWALKEWPEESLQDGGDEPGE